MNSFENRKTGYQCRLEVFLYRLCTHFDFEHPIIKLMMNLNQKLNGVCLSAFYSQLKQFL